MTIGGKFKGSTKSMNVGTKFHGNPSKSCEEIWLKLAHENLKELEEKSGICTCKFISMKTLNSCMFYNIQYTW